MRSKNNDIYEEPSTAWNLIYKGSRNGFEPQDFHLACDGRWNTLTMIQSTEGYLFGGYANVAWNSSGTHIHDSQAFIFTLSDPYNISPTYYALQPGKESNAIFGHTSHGPNFGAGDIYVSSGKQCSFGFPRTYTDTIGKGNQTFTGTQKCAIKEIEVYQAK